MAGRLVLVATPIGNLGDLSPRAVEALRSADAIACEDTRRTGRLLEHAAIARRPLVVINDHTEVRQIPAVLRRLETGDTVALVTDAGTPGISDPGERLVRAAVAAGHAVEVVPGPSAAIAALAVSGLPAGRFVFEGFLPRRGSGRRERLVALADERRTIVLYEAPHRLAQTLADLATAFGGDRRAVVVRELTKLHEEVVRDSLDGLVRWVASEPPRGEVALVVAGAPEPAPADDESIAASVAARLAAGDSVKDAAAEVARALGVPRRRAYDAAVRLAASDGGVNPPPPRAGRRR